MDVAKAAPPAPATLEIDQLVADLAADGVAADLVSSRPDVIFHLAAVVSGEAEADLEKGYRVNLDGTRLLLDAVRKSNAGYRPRVVFASSIAVFGAPFPDVIGDDHCTTPLTSYGTQKAIGELLLSDYGGAASSTASACDYRRSASGRACRTAQRRASSPASSASR